MRRFECGTGYTRISAVTIFMAAILLAFNPLARHDAFAQETLTQPRTAADVTVVEFRPHFEVGRVSVYEFTASVKSETAIEDLKFGGTSGTHLVMRLETVGVNEDEQTAEVRLTYDRLALNGEDSMSGKTYDFDSDRDPAENDDQRVAHILRRLKDATITAIVDFDGRVQSVTGHEAIISAMERNESLGGRVGEFNEDGLKQVLEGLWRVGEESQPRHLGETWTESQDMEMSTVGTLTFSTLFELENATEKTATADVTLDVSIALAKDKVEGEDAAKSDDDDAIRGEDDPDNFVLSPEAKQLAEQKAFEESLPPAESADLTVDKQPGKLIWDRERGELIDRETFLSFSLQVEQFEIFSQEMQTSVSVYDVESRWHRIAAE